MKTLGVVIARFQCHEVTPAHANLLREAMKENQRVVVMLGVHPVPRKKDPLDYSERFTMVWDWWIKNRPAASTKDAPLDFFIIPLMDHPSDEAWARSVDQNIAALGLGGKVTLYCGPDGAAATYTKAGGQHEAKTVASYERHATSVRAALTPRGTEDFRAGIIYASERRYVNPFMCVDILITDGERLLLARKPTDPPNRWRMVGGFVDPMERLESAAMREVKEETGILLQQVTYSNSGVVADWRYAGGPENILSACFIGICRKDEQPVPKDDIAELKWFSLKEGIALDRIHSNHQDMIRRALDDFNRLVKTAEAEVAP